MSKVWLVTGSASGLGRSIAEAVLASGDRLVATARDPRRLDDLVKRYREQVRTAALDVADGEAARGAVKVAAVDAYGRLDVVVNNAGYGDVAPFEQLSPERFKAVIDTNFYGVVNMTRAALPDHAQAEQRLHPADIVSGRPSRSSRERRVPRRQMGGRRVHRIAGPGSRPFRRQGVRARAWRNADQLGHARAQEHSRHAARLRAVRRCRGQSFATLWGHENNDPAKVAQVILKPRCERSPACTSVDRQRRRAIRRRSRIRPQGGSRSVARRQRVDGLRRSSADHRLAACRSKLVNCTTTQVCILPGKKASSCRRLARAVGPYLLIELFLPGGTLVAAGLYLLRRRGCLPT